MKRIVETIYDYAPITRRDDEQRIVEGYAFVNEVVPGEQGKRLTRAAMEKATAEYMEWATLRSMHQPVAAGVVLDISWDQKGAFMRAKVVDDQEWQKVVNGVYKGFSVGVRPRIMRGNNVTDCEWAETSLVDRPKDIGSRFTAFRADSMDQPCECEVFEDEGAEYVERSDNEKTENETIEATENSEENASADNASDDDANGAAADPNAVERVETLAEEPAAAESANVPDPAASPVVESETANSDAGIVQRIEELDYLKRIDALNSDNQALLTRNHNLETEITRVQGQLTAAESEIQRLKNLPVRQPSVRNPQAIQREFMANSDQVDNGTIQALNDELSLIMARNPNEMTPAQRDAASTRISYLKGQLAQLR